MAGKPGIRDVFTTANLISGVPFFVCSVPATNSE
jgi:hypothetical protein